MRSSLKFGHDQLGSPWLQRHGSGGYLQKAGRGASCFTLIKWSTHTHTHRACDSTVTAEHRICSSCSHLHATCTDQQSCQPQL